MAEKFAPFTGIVAPLDRANIDTDQIIPKQFLKSIKTTGFGVHLFDAWRYEDEGFLGKSDRIERSEFVLNQSVYRDAKILLAQANFGCGSSREHAVWALQQWGFRCVIAPSFADIFYNNSINNGFLPAILNQADITELFVRSDRARSMQLDIDLERQVVRHGGDSFAIQIEDFARDRLLQGLDDISLTLELSDQIRAFEAEQRRSMPWLAS